MVKPNSRVLDIGCACGDLLYLLNKKKNVQGQGIEIKHDNVETCLKNGLSVIEGDVNNEITNFRDNTFDYVILSQTIQTVQDPKWVLEQMIRIGKRGIVSFPNFGYWKCRFQLLLKGYMPITKNLEYDWFSTPNIHLCTINDFYNLVNMLDIKIEKKFGLSAKGKKKAIRGLMANSFFNLTSENALFLFNKN